LGHVISKEGIPIDPKKNESIRGWIPPNNMLDVRYFMGLASYYRRFIEGFSNTTLPTTSLQKKGTKFEWTSKSEDSFQHLKELLTNAPILNIADPNENFVVCMDAFKEGFSGVLTQNGYVISYEFINLKEHKRNYATHDL